MLKRCLNRNVLIGAGLVAAAVFLVKPSLLAVVLPLLCFAACPLSMILMMRASRRQAAGEGQPAAGVPADVATFTDRRASERAGRPA